MIRIQAVLISIFAIIIFPIDSLSQIDQYFKPQFQFSDTLSGSFDQVWCALLITLDQDSLRIRQGYRKKGRLLTDYAYLPFALKDTLVGRRLSFMTGWDEKHAIWNNIRCSFEVNLSPIDTSKTIIQLDSKLYIHEDNTTAVWHRFQSQGHLAKIFLHKIQNNLNKIQQDQGVIIPREIDLVFTLGLVSGESEDVFDKHYNDVWIALHKMVSDNSIPLKYDNKSTGLMLSEFTPLSKEQEGVFYTKEVLSPIGGWDKAMAIWEDPFRWAFSFKISSLSDDPAKTNVRIQTFIERYESNTTDNWHRFKSTSTLEKGMLSTLRTALDVFSNMDKRYYLNVHLDSLVTQLFEASITSVWNSAIRSLEARSFKVKLFDVDSCIIVNTEYLPIGQSYHALQFILQKESPNRARVSLTPSCILDNPYEHKIGIQYARSQESICSDFLKNIEENLTDSILQHQDALQYIDVSLIQDHIPDSQLQAIMSTLKTYKVISLIPNYEVFKKGISLSREGDLSNLIISGFISKPFEIEFEDSNYLLSISEWIFRNIVYNMGFSVYHHMKDHSIFNHTSFKTVLKMYNLDDTTPIDNAYHTYSFEMTTNDLIKFLEFETDLEYLMRSSILYFDGTRINLDKLLKTSVKL